MKRRNQKTDLTNAETLLLCGGTLAAYTVPQGQVPMSDLTAANIEAMAVSEQDGVGPCCAPWKNHCGTVYMENGLIYDVSGTPCS